MKKKVLFAAAFMLLAVGAYAQGNGIAASWFGACIFLIVAATILRSFFL